MTTQSNHEEIKTRRLNVTVTCQAVYNSSIAVPANLSFEEAIAYAKAHLEDIPLGTLEYISDSDELDEENCDLEESMENVSIPEKKVSLSERIAAIEAEKGYGDDGEGLGIGALPAPELQEQPSKEMER